MPDYGYWPKYYPWDMGDELPSGKIPRTYRDPDVYPYEEDRFPYIGRIPYKRVNRSADEKRTADQTEPSAWKPVDLNAPGRNYMSELWQFLSRDRGRPTYDHPAIRAYAQPDYAAPEMPPPARPAAAPATRAPMPPQAEYGAPPSEGVAAFRARQGAMQMPPAPPAAARGPRRGAPVGWAEPGGAAPPTSIEAQAPPMSPTGPDGDTSGLKFVAPNIPEGVAQNTPNQAQQTIAELMRGNAGRDKWMFLANLGFGTAAGSSPWAGVNAGAGGVNAMRSYQDATERDAANRLRAATLQLQSEQEAGRASRDERRVGFEEQGLGIRREDLAERRADRSDTRRLKERELAIKEAAAPGEQEERRARVGYYNANAKDTLEGRAEDRRIRAEDTAKARAVDDARAYADRIAPEDKITGMRDKDAWERAYRAAMREYETARGGKAGGEPPKRFPPAGTPIINPKTGERLVSTGSGWAKP